LQEDQPFLADERAGRLQQRVQRGMCGADVEVSPIEANEVAALGGLTDSLDEPLEGRGLLQELRLELLALGWSLLHDLPDLRVTSPIQEGVDEGLRVIACGKSRSLLVLGVDVPL